MIDSNIAAVTPTYEECLDEAYAIHVRAWHDAHSEAASPAVELT